MADGRRRMAALHGLQGLPARVVAVAVVVVVVVVAVVVA